MEPFDIVRNQLTEGACLIEAGAGTGKTYALTAIFLRLLFENQIEPDRILVVTFTTAATAELRDRLRRQLIAVRRFIDGEGPLDDTLRELVERVASPARIRERVVAALREFDRIAIFTIHGFCQRLLTEMAFETGSPFEVELVADPSAWLQEIADDYWREVFFEASPELTAHALDRLRGPETLAHLYQRYRLPDLHVIPVFPDFPPIDFHPYRRHRETLRRQWPGVQTEIATLLKNPGLKGNIYGSLKPAAGPPSGMTKREQKLGAWCRALGYFLRSRTSLFPPCPSLIYFTADKIAASVRKGQTPPLHPFFDQCQEMYDEAARLNVALDQWLAALRYRFFPYADRKLESRKQQRPMMFFDDLLIRVREALDEKRGGDLAATVRKHYQAALVDEFQDTDTIQYQIFKRLFDTADHFLFMIGDPKQAIYGFRGADIFSYLKAARQTRQGYTLLHNWRSTPDLIQAVNTLFESHPRPFLIPEIAFHPAIAARRKITDTGCQPETAPLTVWWIPDGDPAATNTGRRLTKALATDRILDAVAGEVSRLLQPPSNGLEGPRECLPHDIAILVRTNWQARRVKARMTEAGIPAVIHHAGNVFDTREADAFEAVLQAVAQPGDSRKLKTALATRFFGYTGDRLAFTDQTPGWWEDTVQQFYRYHSIWQEIGFYPFFRRMMSENQIAGRLLAFTDGERRLTNLLHLGELLHQAVTQQRTGLQGALKWLGLQKSMLSGSVEEQQLRMESDARALTILTIHKSKGLEFPIVFCPFCWESDPGARDWPLFHDPGADMRRTLDLGADTGSENHQRARLERLAEALRLLYVAITRAKSGCYLVWGALPSAEGSALGYLLNTSPVAAADLRQNASAKPPGKQTRSRVAENPDADLSLLTQAAAGTIAVASLPGPPTSPATFGPPRVALQSERSLHRRFDTRWAIASFSSLLNASGPEAEEIDERDQDQAVTAPAAIRLADDGPAEKLIEDMHLFPRGARAGNFFHRLFEILDYNRDDRQTLKAAVESELARYGFKRQWISPVTRLIENVLATPLTSIAPAFCLNGLGPRDCVKELPFCFPLNPLKARRLRQVFHNHDLPLSGHAIDRQLKKMDFFISGGYLRGFIDLVFRIRGRYFLLDWKSNLLGETYADYHPDRIKAVMADDYYFLQYHIYTVALDQFLRLRLPDYSYKTDFGGVYYLFIRGMRPEPGAGRGVFHDRPAADLLRDLRRLLVAAVSPEPCQQ